MIRAIFLPRLGSSFRPLVLMTQAIELAHQRAALARLDTTALNDIGVSPKDAHREAQRGFWDIPAHWRA